MFFTRCPIGCGSRLNTSGITLPEGELLICPECGQLLSQADEAVYNEAMQRFESQHGVDPNPRAHLRRLRRLEHYWHIPPKDTRILDVGCSFGTFLRILNEKGFNAEGVEPAENAAEQCRRAGLNVHCGLLGDMGFQDGQFDVLTIYEVIEHLPDPRPLIEECYRVLRKGGMMFLSTGNAQSWTARVMGGGWDYFSMLDGGQGHISFFNPESISRLSESAGFSVERIETRSVRFVHKNTHTGARYALGKLAQEALGIPAKLLSKGHEMLAVLRK
jgi:2-polyprenyl-3-methyl-5-hydroxy-6-metoxy-1,4-benzoquinol methylase